MLYDEPETLNIYSNVYNVYSNVYNVYDVCEILHLEKYKKYKYVVATNNKIKYIIGCFGGNIIKIDVKKNKIEKIEKLPIKLKTFICERNLILELNNLPKKLINLNCSFNMISQLNNLPLELKSLDCSNNNILNLDYLPETILYLNCENNKITTISNLPNSIQILKIKNNPIEIFDCFPTNLIVLECSCSNSNIKSILNVLPMSIEKIYIENNSIENFIQKENFYKYDILDFSRFTNLTEIQIIGFKFNKILLPDNITRLNLKSCNFNLICFGNSQPISVKLEKTNINIDKCFFDIMPTSIKILNFTNTKLNKYYYWFVKKHNLNVNKY